MLRRPLSDDRLRAMYAGGRGNATARRFARFWAVGLGTGLCPRRWVTLEVAGRRTGRITRFPLGMADWQGHWYLVSMLGNECNWVRNVRAAGGLVTLRHGRARARRLVEVPVAERAPILKRYLQKVPGARPHIPVHRSASLAEFEAIAERYPAFRVAAAAAPAPTPEESRR
jgi:F420H(2)-dependent quinone reductase